MVARIRKASDWSHKEIVDVISMEDLYDLMEEYGHAVIVRKASVYDNPDVDIVITIYDDYVE